MFVISGCWSFIFGCRGLPTTVNFEPCLKTIKHDCHHFSQVYMHFSHLYCNGNFCVRFTFVQLKTMEADLATVRRQNTKLIWLQGLIFLIMALFLVYLVYFRSQEGALHTHTAAFHTPPLQLNTQWMYYQ